MTIFELIRQEVTAEQVARLYGLKFDMTGRGFCPWHDDGRHAALKFYDNGTCYCFACHKNGDAVDMAAELLGLKPIEAAQRIKQDFHLDKPIDGRPNPIPGKLRERKQDQIDRFNERWIDLCEWIQRMDKVLKEYTPETVDEWFDVCLKSKCKAQQELDLMWKRMKEGDYSLD